MKRRFLLLILALAIFPMFAHAQATTVSVKLTWTDTVNPAGTSYNVRRGNSATACTSASVATDTCTLLNSAPLTVLTFTDTPAIGGVYTYNVRAVSSIGLESPNSNVATATLTLPGSPTLNCTITITGSVVSGSCK
jgi:hypothetical protein